MDAAAAGWGGRGGRVAGGVQGCGVALSLAVAGPAPAVGLPGRWVECWGVQEAVRMSRHCLLGRFRVELRHTGPSIQQQRRFALGRQVGRGFLSQQF